MRLPACIGCSLPVLGLEGQRTKLDSYYLDGDGPPSATAGFWHTRCLTESPHGVAWYQLRLRNHVGVRSFRIIAETSTWTIAENAQRGERLAFAKSGQLLDLSILRGTPQRSGDALVFPVVVDDYNLELDDPETIADMQQALESRGTYPLADLLSALGIRERMQHVEVLDSGVFRFTRGGRRRWRKTWVCARAEYGLFVPAELVPHLPPRLGP